MLLSKPTIVPNSLTSRIVGTSSATTTKPATTTTSSTTVEDPSTKPMSSYSYGRENEQLLEMLGLTKKKKKGKSYDYQDKYGLDPEADQGRLSDSGYMDISQLLALKGY